MMKMKEVKEVIWKELKYRDYEYDSKDILVKVYDCDESGEQTYDVEVMLYIEGEYVDTWVTNTFYEGEEKQAMKRAREVRISMKNEFGPIDKVEMYHM